MSRLKSRNTLIVLMLLLACVTLSCRRNPAPVATAAPVAPPPPPPPAPAPTITLTATPSTVNSGQPVTLAWQSTNATTVDITPEVGNVAATGNRQITPASSITYTATARGAGGNATAVQRVTVNAAPPPPPTDAGAPVRPTVTSLSTEFDRAFTSQPILFDYDKSDIRADQISKLQGQAGWLKKNASVRLSIEGHADERGSQEYNVALGDERAAAVMKYLTEQGVSAGRMTSVSYGEERPTCRTLDEACLQANRRASFAMAN